MSNIKVAGFSAEKLKLAQILDSTTKVEERRKSYRKSLIQLEQFFLRVSHWQNERKALSVSNNEFNFLIAMILGEISEVLERRIIEGFPEYDFKSEKGEVIDVGFFLASLTFFLNQLGKMIDFDEALHRANGQAKGSNALERLTEIAGNMTLKTIEKDLEDLWMSWSSYIINMKYPVNPNQVLSEYTLPKNSNNYVANILSYNPLFELRFGRKLDEDENKAYFAHYRKATRIIRDFMIAFVDPQVEHNGFTKEKCIPYLKYIYSFTSELGYSSDDALAELKKELYKDYGIKETKSGLLVVKNLAFAD